MPVSNAHELYGLPLERFVPERTALARALRDEGQRKEAAKVAKLPKPSIAAWAVNQLVRTQRRAISDLFDAGDALQKAQEDLLTGRSDGAALRQAAERERRAVEALMERARGLLSSEGHELSQTTLDRVGDTLHAAAVDEEVRSEVKEGCLQKEVRHAGLGGGGAALGSAATGTRKGAGSPARIKQRPAKSTADRERGGQRADADRQRARKLEAARRTESDTRRAADLAQRKLDKAQERRDRADAALQEADDELAAARREAKEADRAHSRAQQALDRI